MRSLGAIIAGATVAAIGYWIGAVIALLAMHGIPLGSAGGKATNADVLAHFLIAAAATSLGVTVTMRIDRYRARRSSFILGVLLASAALIGFSKPSSSWPSWFPIGMAVACLLTASGAGRMKTNIR